MAIYHLHSGFVSRSSGRTSVQSAAYICGEKLHEDLMTPEELLCAEDNGDLFIIRNELNENHPDFIYNSSEIEQLSKNEILKVLSELD